MIKNKFADPELETESLDMDVRRVATVVAERYRNANIAITWQHLVDIEEEVLCDITLLSRWRLEQLELYLHDDTGVTLADLVTEDAIARFNGLRRFIFAIIERTSRAAPATQ